MCDALAGFLASATAAVALAEPLAPAFGFLGEAAEPVAIAHLYGDADSEPEFQRGDGLPDVVFVLFPIRHVSDTSAVNARRVGDEPIGLAPTTHAFLKALASPTRQRIMLLFARGAELSVGEIAERVGISQSTASE